MAVFACTSCGRLLFRPEEFLGRAWQCPTCGPTIVSQEPTPVEPELATLLEKEYVINMYDVAILAPSALHAVSVASEPMSPSIDRVGLLKRIKADCPLGLSGMVAATIVALVIVALGFASGVLTSMPLADYYTRLIVIVIFAALTFAAIVALSTLTIGAIRRRRVLRAIDGQRHAKRSGTQTIDEPSQSVPSITQKEQEAARFHDKRR